MKITHMIFSLHVGGAESMLVDIMNEQVRLGHHVEFVIVNDKINLQLERTIDPKVKVIKLNRIEKSRNPLFLLKIYTYLYFSKPDVVHAHDINLGKLLKAYSRYKIITVHDTRIYRPEVKSFDKVVAISKAVQTDVFERGACESIIIHNGVNTKAIRVKSNFERKPLYNILQVSRLDHKKKGQDIAIKAIAEIKKSNSTLEICLTFIGVGPSEEYLKSLVDKLHLEDSVKFLGLKEKTYIYHHLNEYDLLIQPSIYEGFGLTIIEGMAAKVPVIVSAIEGPMEVIKEGELGIYFESGHYEELAIKILQEVKNESTLVEKAYAYTLENYDISQTVARYIELYKK